MKTDNEMMNDFSRKLIFTAIKKVLSFMDFLLDVSGLFFLI